MILPSPLITIFLNVFQDQVQHDIVSFLYCSAALAVNHQNLIAVREILAPALAQQANGFAPPPAAA